MLQSAEGGEGPAFTRLQAQALAAGATTTTSCQRQLAVGRQSAPQPQLAGSELARKALGPHIFDRYVELKRKEWDEYRVQLTEWELERYLSAL